MTKRNYGKKNVSVKKTKSLRKIKSEKKEAKTFSRAETAKKKSRFARKVNAGVSSNLRNELKTKKNKISDKLKLKSKIPAKRNAYEADLSGTNIIKAKSKIPFKKKLSISHNDEIKIIFLGGLDQIGMNMTAFESDSSIVIVDCGVSFPDETMPGIDLVIPNVSYLNDRKDKIKGFFITHGHEDHIGALPYILRNLNFPVYCTRLTRALIELKLKESQLLESSHLYTVEYGDVIEAGDFFIEFIKTNHSIQDAAALALHTRAGVIIHTGDFKVDYTPVFGGVIDLPRFAKLGDEGVLALLCDSTNAERPGITMSERSVGHTFENIFGEYNNKRIIVATFSSNIDRVQQVITVAEKYGRKVVIDGRSMLNVIGAARELNYIKIKPGTLVDISQMSDYPPQKLVLIVTGSQGEPMAVLSRMAIGQHKKVKLGENDCIILSSNPIPGNEKAVSKIINDLSKLHSKVIYQDTHVSGHACAEDIKLIYCLTRPKFAIPVHGEYRHRLAGRGLAIDVGVCKKNCIMAQTGDVVALSTDFCSVTDHVEAGGILVDGLGVGDIGNVVIKDRQDLSENGILIAAVTLDQYTGEVLSGPVIVTRGFVYEKENKDLIKGAEDVVLDALYSCLSNRNLDISTIKNIIREVLKNYIWKKIKRAPLILPVILEA